MSMGAQTETTWIDAKDVLSKILEHGHQAMFAGGCVRDRLLGMTPKDYDIATTAASKELIELFKAKSYRVIPTGIDHGTVTVLTPSGPVEVTTLRRDVHTDGRHAIVEFKGATFESDAQRRDFTINGLFEDHLGNIHDFVGGVSDLNQKQLRFVGNPSTRIKEDYLRILRFFRFWARFDFTPQDLALQEITPLKSHLASLSMERVMSELWLILEAPFAWKILPQMLDLGIFEVIFKHYSRSPSSSSQVFQDAKHLSSDARTWYYFMMLVDIKVGSTKLEDCMKDFAKEYRLSDRDLQTLCRLTKGVRSETSTMTTLADQMDFMDQLDRPSIGRSFQEFFAPVLIQWSQTFQDTAKEHWFQSCLATDLKNGSLRQNSMPINGHDILNHYPQIKARHIGVVLEALKREFRNGTWSQREEGLQLLKKIMLTVRDSDDEAQ